MSLPAIRHIDATDFDVGAPQWPLAVERRADIDRNFAERKRAQPKLWNGRVLLFRDVACHGGTLAGRAFETDFASFLWWRGTGFPDDAVRNVFGMAAVRGRDGGFLLGVMADHTAAAGQVYFPAGTPDPGDVRGGRVDLAGSVVRELREETGLDAVAFRAEPGWTAVFAGPRIAVIKVFAADQTCAALLARVRAGIGADPEAELADVIAVYRRADIPAAAPVFMRAYLTASLSD
ncbi:NUDIX hydrolase [Blastochloris viridis]|uniref:NUDIX hydrolase n=1 Tax=Blastochloris viridis TaxID=1079 RepID=A0A0H5BFB8_BLAVI|nr:NUDIX hydrolase [Blastochloris viridis]ALK10964.1 hypothetical protein BVIR_3207 [Blastochloris viridis]BAR99051.1 hypothetical protein BV133_1458 [Blastochloris viridis]CUU43626.1 hypothetical protein BVIRIDIS_26510 [Blastochloris viridis]